MRDDDLTFVELVQRELCDVCWPEPAEIRSRAQRRGRRLALVAAVAVLVVASGSAVALAAHPEAGPTVAGLAGPPVTADAEIPARVLLSEVDLPVRADTELGDAGRLGVPGLGEAVRVDTQLEWCAREQGVTAAPVESRYSRSRSLLLNLKPNESLPQLQPVLAQDVYRVAPSSLARVFVDLDRFVAVCATWRQTTPTQWDGRAVTVSTQHRWQVVERNFAGDRAVLLRHTESLAVSGDQPRQTVSYEFVRAVVQVGDLVTVLTPDAGRTADPPHPSFSFDEGQLRDLAQTAAGRMCLAANPAC